MFAPDGYSFFQEIERRIYGLVSEAYPFRAGRTVKDVIVMRREGRHGAMAEFAWECPSLSVASADGKLLRISSLILAQRDTESLGNVFPFLNTITGLVDTGKAEKLSDWASKVLVKVNEAMDAGPEQAYELEGEASELFKLSEDREFISVFAMFNDWSVVCRTGDLPNSIKQFEVLQDAFSASQSEGPSSKEVVEILVSTIDSGERPNREQFRETTCPHMKRDEFRAVWAEAARKRPELSKPGPKSLKKLNINSSD